MALVVHSYTLCVCVCFSTEQLQVCDGHFAFLVSFLSYQPVRIHSRDRVNSNQLEQTDRGEAKVELYCEGKQNNCECSVF